MFKELSKTLKHVWQDERGGGEIFSSIMIVIFAVAGSGIVLGILYTALKVFAAKTGQGVMDVSP